MDRNTILLICKQALALTIMLSAPALLAALLVGLIISIFQAATQIQEQTLSYVPKIVVVCVVLALLSGWMLQKTEHYTRKDVLELFPTLLHNTR